MNILDERHAKNSLLFSCMTNGAASVGHVVDEDGDAVLDIAHQHHRGDFVGLAPLLVDQRKLHVQSIGY